MKTKLWLIVSAFFLLTVSQAFAHASVLNKEYVDSLLTPYLQMHQALAQDDLKAAQKKSHDLVEVLKEGPSEKKAKSLTSIRKFSEAITQVTTIDKARELFLYLSKEMIVMVEHVGTTGKTDIFEIRCSMAFNNKGGNWLQTTQDVANPYYGASMLQCGIVKNHLIKMGKADLHKPHID